MPSPIRAVFTDTETYSEIGGPGDVGAHKYAKHCELLMAGWVTCTLTGTEVSEVGEYQHWDSAAPDNMCLEEYKDLLNDPAILKLAQNSQFDRRVLHHTLGTPTDPKQWWCTQTMALLHALPGAQDPLTRVLQLPTDLQKQKEGKALIRRFCQPAPRHHKADRYDATSHPKEWAQFLEYMRIDTVGMVAMYDRIPKVNWTESQIALWHLDQEMNDKGVLIDRELAEAGAAEAITRKAILRERFLQLTGGITPGQRAKCQGWLNEHGVPVEDTKKETFEAILDDYDQKDPVRLVMEIMIASNKSSTSKYQAALDRIDDDDTLRGILQFSGAGRTRRWAGRGMQLHNMPSRGIPSQDKIDIYTGALRDGIADLLYGDDAMMYGAAAVRNLIIPRPGHKFVVSDLSNIEGRKVAWFAHETWKLEAFAAFDRGEGPDLYNVTAASIVGGDPLKLADTKAEAKTIRNVFGKVPELAFGFQGGVVGMGAFCKAYGVKMADHWGVIKERTKPHFIDKAQENFNEWGHKMGVEQSEYVARETIKLAWRARHPATKQLWYDLDSAAKSAVKNPGPWYPAGKLLRFTCRRHPVSGINWLFMRLPSGQFCCYPFARVDDKGTLRYQGIHQKNKQWTELSIYGGKFLENASQSSARDILADAGPPMRDAGYETLFTVHDEGIAEVPNETRFTEKEYSNLLKSNPVWAQGLPLAAEGDEVMMYQKI